MNVFSVTLGNMSYGLGRFVGLNVFSSNINEVIGTILDFFIQKFHEQKKKKKHKKLTSEQK